MMFVPKSTYAAHHGISSKHAWYLAKHGKVPSRVNERGEWFIDITTKPPRASGTKYTLRLDEKEECVALQRAEGEGLSVERWLKKIIREAL